jgi:hypothetical protein
MKLISGLQTASGFVPSKWVIEVQDPSINATRQIIFDDAIAIEVAARLAKELTIIGNTGLDTSTATLGNLPSLSTMNYIAAATDILNACELLDAALKATDDAAVICPPPVYLTNAEIAAIYTTPKTLINAPGVGYYIYPIAINIKHIFGSAAWVTPDVIYAKILGCTSLFQDTFDVLTGTSTRMCKMVPTTTTGYAVSGTQYAENQPLQLTSLANPTGGAGCTARVDIIYKILPW